VADAIGSVVEIFQQNHLRDQIGERAIEACKLLADADTKLRPTARRSWRWRLFRIRATLDQELYRKRLGMGRQEVFRQAYQELMSISHAENAAPMLRPVLIPASTNSNARLN
jgi:hypothetical protein